MTALRLHSPRLRVAFGPEMPGWGSWDWLGADTARALAESFETSIFPTTFSSGALPDCDVAVIVKHLPPHGIVQAMARRCAVIYCPVDYYDSAASVADDAATLRLCSTIVVHCRRLRPYFQQFAPVEYLDHHLKFTSEAMLPYRRTGHVLWVGVRSNLPPLVEWLNATAFDLPLLVLANFEDGLPPRAEEIGLRRGNVCLKQWSPETHRLALAGARAALDIKGHDFRQRHKPPTKAFDYLASGLPLAMNDSSSTEHLAEMGFDVASPLDLRRWFSHDYWLETAAFGGAIRELLSLRRIAARWKRLILKAFHGRAAQGSNHQPGDYRVAELVRVLAVTADTGQTSHEVCYAPMNNQRQR